VSIEPFLPCLATFLKGWLPAGPEAHFRRGYPAIPGVLSLHPFILLLLDLQGFVHFPNSGVGKKF
jgi:hypothetical protein